MSDADVRERLQASLGQAFTLDQELGGGGMSRVFVATDTTLGRKVVVKVLPPELAQEVSTARFAREVQLAARLQHPHIVPLLGVGDANGLPWYTMPFVEGESLRARLERGGELPIAEVVRILREVASALAYAHSQGVVHRDIKPENVLLSAGTAMVSDFGVAKAVVAAEGVGDLTSRGIALGTPAYMAPEQGMADPRTDHRADIYAFGVMAYEMLAGQTPFAGRSPQAMLAAHVTEAPDPIDRRRATTTPALVALVMHCLAKSPADRPQQAQELVRALDAVATPTSGTTPYAKTPDMAHRSGVRRPYIVVAALFFAAVGGWAAWQRLRPAPLAERRIAVAPFKNDTGDSTLDVVGRMTADVLTRELLRSDSTDVVSKDAVTAALSGTAGDVDVVARLARATGASLIVHGTIYPRGDSLRLEALITDERSGKTLHALDPATALRSDPGAAIESVRDRLLGALSIDRTILEMTRAPKLSAYRAYTAGEELFRKTDYLEARLLLQRAISLDTTLFAAYQYLAVSYSNVGMWDSAAVVHIRLSRFQDRFTSDEREWFDWLTALMSGDQDRLFFASQRLAARAPGLPEYLAGSSAFRSGRARVALEYLLKSDSTEFAKNIAVGFQVFQLAEAYHLNQRHADELSMLRARRPDYPNEPRLPARELRALAALHRATEASALADTLLRGTTEPEHIAIPQGVLYAAMELDAHGDSAAGALLAQQVVSWHRKHPSAAPSAARSVQHGIAWLLVGSIDSARMAFTRAARDTMNVPAAGYLGVTLARRGDPARARAIADSIGVLQRKWLFGVHNFWRAAILAELGEREAAVRLLSQAYREGVFKPSWHYVDELRSLRGYPPFEALIAPMP